MAKTRVAPIKKVTLPHLELCGALLLAQLMKHLQEVLAIPTCSLYALTDSTIVLYWIHGSSQRFKTFEANRIAEIQEHVPPANWRHVNGKENPADVGSRGISPEEIKEHKLWWNGPNWLEDDPRNWSSQFAAPPSMEKLYSTGVSKENLQLKEKEEVTLQTTTTTQAKPVIDIQRYSSYNHLMRVTTWVFRVVTRSRLFNSTHFEEITTVLCQIEACLNSRPLTTSLDANDDDGVAPLTPGHFLIGRPLEALPDHISTESIHGLKRWHLCQALIQHFWKRWSSEYLNGLQRYNKWKLPKRNLRIDDIVLIKDNRTPSCQWPLGRIVKTHPGPDQLVRVVTVKTKAGNFIRPIVKLCLLLPVKDEQKTM